MNLGQRREGLNILYSKKNHIVVPNAEAKCTMKWETLVVFKELQHFADGQDHM